MSGVIRGIKKAFKKVAKFVKKNWKKIAIAAAIVFTAGVALSYFAPATAASLGAAGVPGFGASGIFTGTAAALGGGAAASATAGLSAGTVGTTAGLQSTFAGYAAATATSTGAWSAPMLLPAATTVAKAATAMSTFEKIALLQMGVSTVAGLLTKPPEANPIQRQYGTYDKKGKGPGMAVAFNPSTGQVERVSNGQMSFQSSATAQRQEQAAPAETQVPEGQELIAQDEGQPANAAKSQPSGQELIADADLNPTGGPTLEDRQSAVAQGYKTGDYSGVG